MEQQQDDGGLQGRKAVQGSNLPATTERQVAASKAAIKRSFDLLKRSAKPPKGPYWG